MTLRQIEFRVEPHPLLDLRAFTTEFPNDLSPTSSGDSPVFQLLQETQGGAEDIPCSTNDDVRKSVRDLLRYGGFKPTGRNKPASEYLLRAVNEHTLSSINLAVDACNVVSYHSGLPISVIDLDRATLPLRVAIAPAGSEYIFNSSGQVLKLDGLLCLFDADAPCANAVKDAERTKTREQTRRTLTLIWGTNELPNYSERAETWYRKLLQQNGAQTSAVRAF